MTYCVSSVANRRSRFLVTAAIGALVTAGFDLHGALAQQAQGQVQGQVQAQPQLPPVVVQGGTPVVRPATETTQIRGERRRRAARSVRPATRPAQAPVPAASSGEIKPRDGIDGYFAYGTSAGTKMATPILELPRSVSTITAQEMTDRDVQTTREALQYTAGVNSYFREGQFTREYGLIRGFQGLQFLDGLRLNVNNYGIERYGLERIDVLKGPAATLYGQGSPGGLWDMTSKRPTDTAFAEALVRLGSYSALQGAFDVGGPVTSDKSLLYRFVGVGKIGDGQIDFTRNERAYLAPSFTWRPNEDTSITVLASWQYDPKLTVLQPLPFRGTALPGPTGQFIPRTLFVGEPGYHDTSIEQFRIAYELKHRMNDVFAFEQRLAYQNIDIKLHEVQSRANPNTTTTSRLVVDQAFQIDMYQVDNKLTADFDMGPLRHHAIFGIDYSATPSYQGTGQNTAGPYTLNLYNPVYGQALPASNPLTSHRYQDWRQAGFYAQDRVELGRLSVLLGVRWDDVVQGQKTRVLNLNTGALSNPAWSIQPDQAATYNAGLIYNFSNGIAPYFSYSQTFTPTTGTDFFGRGFVPVTGDQKEVGIKYIPPGVPLLMTLAAFDIVQYNVLTNDVAHAGFAVQTSSVQSQGAEFELKTTHIYGLNISAAYTYLDAKVIATNTVGGLGKHPVATPMNQASLWTTYRFAGGALDGLTVGGGVRFVGNQAGDPLNTFAVPSFTLFDLTARYQLGAVMPTLANWDIALNVKNVADTRYVGSCDDSLNCYYGAGRNISGALRARF